ncbi:MAG TPA: hypothetical protein VKM55_03840 [Candidatus Lokiarchaeia archaeon]|nr:hypothetical protein [Candidatus Lokiarchaeia archaeon]
MDSLIIFLYAIAIAGFSFVAFIILVRIFYPAIFRKYVVPGFEGSYDPDQDQVSTPGKITDQSSRPVITMDPDTGNYRVEFGENRALEHGLVRAFFKGTRYSSNPSEGESRLDIAGQEAGHRETSLGEADFTLLRWHVPGTAIEFETIAYIYPGEDFAVFEANFPSGLEAASSGDHGIPSISFPSLENPTPNQRVLCFKNQVFCPAQRDFTFTTSPVLMFDDNRNAFLISALDNFITHGIQKTRLESGNVRLDCGPNGLINELPARHQFAYILIFHHGINDSFMRWGELLRKYNVAPEKDRYMDLATSKLGYFTDNGAYYYYRPIKRKFDKTLIAIKQYADKEHLPFAFYHLDSWWYEKTVKTWKRALVNFFRIRLGGALYGGAVKWEPDPYYFDMSLAELSKTMGNVPFTAHHRWYSDSTPYKDRFQFLMENGWAMSVDPAYWDFIMEFARNNNIILYEQDWMISHSNHFHVFKTEIGFGESWLREMAEAAANHGITIQYCMATPAMWMASIRFPNVTNARGSNDYHADWPHVYDVPFFTQSSILARAVGLNPFKDVFFTTKRGIMWGERCPELEGIVSALSSGPVAPGDPIGHVDKRIVHACCRPDGTLLKPDRPLTAVDAMFTKHGKYYICSTESKHGDLTWHYVLVTNLWPKRVIDKGFTLQELDINGDYVEYDFDARTARVVHDDERIEFELHYEHHALHIYAPLLGDGLAIIGDASRYAMANDKTFVSFKTDSAGVEAIISGIEGDTIEVAMYCPNLPSAIQIDGIDVHTHIDDHAKNNCLKFIPIEFQNDREKVFSVIS